MAFNLTAQLSVALNTASLKNAANTINSQLKDVGAVSLGIPKNDADNLRYIKVQAAEASTAMEQFGRQSGLAAKRFVAFTLTAGAIITFTSSLKQALTAAVEFDREMVRLTQVSTDSVGQVGAVGNEVSRLSKNYGVSSKDLLTTAVTLKQANLSLADTKVALEALAQAALAPSFDNLRDTTEGAIAVMNQFGISAKDLGNALGAINAVAAEFAVEAQDLIEGVRKAGGAFKAAGGDLNEFLALFTSIRQTTRESAESIGTGLRTIFTRVQRNETVEALKDIGVQLRYTADEAKAAGDLGLANQFVGPYEAVKRLSGALNELRSTDPRFSAIIEELGGYRQISKVIPLIQEFGVAQKALGVAQIGGASLALNAAQAQEAFGVKIQKVKEEFADFIRNLTNTSSFRSLIDLLLGAASAGIALADSLKGILPVITAIAAVKTAQSLTGFAKGFGSTAFAPAPASQPSTFSPFLPTGTRRASGGIIKMAKGGFVPGVGRGDKVPALLEPGEFVIPRNRFDQGGTVAVTSSKSKEVFSRIYDSSRNPTDEDYRKGKVINPKDKFSFSVKVIPINDQNSAEQKTNALKGETFEQTASQQLGAARTKGGFPIDLVGANGYPYEVKNVGKKVDPAILADKLARFNLRVKNQAFKNENLSDEINLGEIGLVVNTANTSKKQLSKYDNDKNSLYTMGTVAQENATNQKGKGEYSKRIQKDLRKPKFAIGGLVPGVGNTDSVPLDLPIGSYVIKKSSVNSIGASNLSRLGRASGGVIPALVMPGEYIYSPDETKQIGVHNLDHMNTTGRKKFASGGYGTFTKEDIKVAKQIEKQYRIPTSAAGKDQNRQQAIAVVEDMNKVKKEVVDLQKTIAPIKKDIVIGIKLEKLLNEQKEKQIQTLAQKDAELKKAIKAEQKDIRAGRPTTASTAARVAAEQAQVDATADLAVTNKGLADTRKKIGQDELKKSRIEGEVQVLKNKYKENPDGNITKDGQVITSTYGNAYKKEIRKELANYKAAYGEEATGGTRKEIRENTAQRLKAGYFNQIKSFSEARGLEFDEKFANKQAQQMARETVAGRRKFEVSDKGEFYDPVLAKRLQKEGYSETGKKGLVRKGSDFLKNTFSKDNLQNNIFAASTGLGMIGGSFDLSDAKAKEAVANKNEDSYKAGGSIAGGLTGAAAGAAVGSFLGPLGIAAGFAIGGLTGLVTGFRDAAKQIADIKLEQAGTQLKNAFAVASTSFGKISATNLKQVTDLQDKIDASIDEKVKSSSSFFSFTSIAQQEATSGKAERRTQYAGQASGINSLLSKQIEEEIKPTIVLDEKTNTFKPKDDQKFDLNKFFEDSANSSQLAKLSIGLDQPIEKLKKQFETFAKDFEKQQISIKNQTLAIKSTEQLNIAFSLLANASTNAALSLSNLSPKFQTITDALSSNFSISQKQRISSDVQSSLSNPSAFAETLKDVSSGLGSSGANFQKSGNIVANISALLPDILANINPNDIKGGKDPQTVLRGVLTQELKDRGFDPSQTIAYVNSIVGKMGEDFNKMLNESGGDYGEFAKKIMSGASEPFLKAYQTIAANLEKASDTYVAGINKLAQETLKTVQEFDKLSKIQQQTRNFSKNIAIENEINKQKKANPLGARFGEIKEGQIGLDMTNISDQTQAFAEQQARLTGLNNGNQLDPQQIQDRINQNRINTEAAEARRKNARFTAGADGRGQDTDATNELGRLKVEASLLNQAMRNLADSTEEVSAIEQRVGKIRQEIANEEQDNARKQSETENRGEKLLTSSPEQLQRLQAGSQLTSIAKELGGNLLRFNVEQRKAIFEYLDFSGEEGKKLKSEFLQASGFVSKPETKAQDKYGPQLLQLNAQLFAAMAVREQAQSLIIQDQQTLQGQFFAQLTLQNEQFFARLSAELSKTQIAQQEQSIRNNDAKIAEIQAVAPSARLMDNFVSQESYTKYVAPNSKDITTFLSSVEKQKGIESKALNFRDIKDKQNNGQADVIAANSVDQNGVLNTGVLLNQLAANKNLAGLDINAIAAKVREYGGATGKFDPGELVKAIKFAVGQQFTTMQSKEVQTQVGLSDKLGLDRRTDELGNFSFANNPNAQGDQANLGSFVLNLLKQNVTSSAFSKAIDDIQRLGGFIGEGFKNQIVDLQTQSNFAAQTVQNLNAQLNLLNAPRNLVAPVNPVAPPVLRRSTGGMVTHASAMVGADPTIFKPIGPDTIPAMLNHGEYVVNAKATSENLPLLQALNGGGTVKPTKAMNDGGPVKYLADGAFVDPAAAALGAPLNVNRIEAQRIAKMQRQQNVDIAVLTKFGNLRGSWRRNALNNSLRIMKGDADLTNIPYRDGALPISAVVSKQNIAPWSMITNISDTGLNIENLNPQKLDKINRMAISGQIYAMPLAIKQVPYQQILDATEDYLRANRNQMLGGVQAIDPVDRDGNSRAYYERRANLKPYFEDLLMAGSPPDITTIGGGYFERVYGLKDVKNIKVMGFSKGGQANGRTPAMVQSGEFIINADKAKKNKGLLDYMNGGGKVSYLNLGGEPDDFIRNSFNPGVEKLKPTLRRTGQLKFLLEPQREDPSLPELSFKDKTAKYLGERKSNQFQRYLEYQKRLEELSRLADSQIVGSPNNEEKIRIKNLLNEPQNIRLGSEIELFPRMYNRGFKENKTGTGASGSYSPLDNVAATFPGPDPIENRAVGKHELVHAVTNNSQSSKSPLNNSIFGSLNTDKYLDQTDKGKTTFGYEASAVYGMGSNPEDKLKRLTEFSSSLKEAKNYQSEAHKNIALSIRDGESLPVSGILEYAGQGREMDLINEAQRRASEYQPKTTSILQKSLSANQQSSTDRGIIQKDRPSLLDRPIFGSEEKPWNEFNNPRRDRKGSEYQQLQGKIQKFIDTTFNPGYEALKEALQYTGSLRFKKPVEPKKPFDFLNKLGTDMFSTKKPQPNIDPYEYDGRANFLEEAEKLLGSKKANRFKRYFDQHNELEMLNILEEGRVNELKTKRGPLETFKDGVLYTPLENILTTKESGYQLQNNEYSDKIIELNERLTKQPSNIRLGSAISGFQEKRQKQLSPTLNDYGDASERLNLTTVYDVGHGNRKQVETGFHERGHILGNAAQNPLSPLNNSVYGAIDTSRYGQGYGVDTFASEMLSNSLEVGFSGNPKLINGKAPAPGDTLKRPPSTSMQNMLEHMNSYGMASTYDSNYHKDMVMAIKDKAPVELNSIFGKPEFANKGYEQALIEETLMRAYPNDPEIGKNKIAELDMFGPQPKAKISELYEPWTKEAIARTAQEKIGKKAQLDMSGTKSKAGIGKRFLGLAGLAGVAASLSAGNANAGDRNLGSEEPTKQVETGQATTYTGTALLAAAGVGVAGTLAYKGIQKLGSKKTGALGIGLGIASSLFGGNANAAGLGKDRNIGSEEGTKKLETGQTATWTSAIVAGTAITTLGAAFLAKKLFGKNKDGKVDGEGTKTTGAEASNKNDFLEMLNEKIDPKGQVRVQDILPEVRDAIFPPKQTSPTVEKPPETYRVLPETYKVLEPTPTNVPNEPTTVPNDPKKIAKVSRNEYTAIKSFEERIKNIDSDIIIGNKPSVIDGIDRFLKDIINPRVLSDGSTIKEKIGDNPIERINEFLRSLQVKPKFGTGELDRVQNFIKQKTFNKKTQEFDPTRTTSKIILKEEQTTFEKIKGEVSTFLKNDRGSLDLERMQEVAKQVKRWVSNASKIKQVSAGKPSRAAHRFSNIANLAEMSLPFLVDPISNYMNDYSVEEIRSGLGETATGIGESLPMMAAIMAASSASPLLAAGVGITFLGDTSNALQDLGDAFSSDKSSAGKQEKVIQKYGGVFPGVQQLFDKQAVDGLNGKADTTLAGDITNVVGTTLAGAGTGAAFGLPGIAIGATAGLLIASYKIYQNAQAASFKKAEMQKVRDLRRNLQGRYDKRGQGNFSPDFFDKYDSKDYINFALNKPQAYFNNFSDEIESYGIYSDPEFKNLKSNKYLNQYPFSAVPDAVLAEKLESDKKGSIEAFMSEISELQKGSADEKTLQAIRDRYRADYSTAFLDDKTKNESVLDSDKADVFSKLFINKDTNVSSLKDKILNDRKNESRIAEIASRLGIVPEKEMSEYDFGILKEGYDIQNEKINLNEADNRTRINEKLGMLEEEKIIQILKSLKVENGFVQKYRSPEYINTKSNEVSKLKNEYDLIGKKFEIPPSYKELSNTSTTQDINKNKNENENQEYIKKLKEEMETDLFGGVYKERTTVEDLKSYINLMIIANKELFYQDSNNGFSTAEGRPISSYEGLIPQRIKNANKIDFKNINKSLANSGRNKEIVQAFYGNKLFDNKDQDILSYINKGFEGDVLDETDFYNFDGNKIRKELNLSKLSELSSKDILEYFSKNKDIGYSWNGQKKPLAMASGGIVPSSAPNPDPSFFVAKGSDTVPAILSPGEYVVNAKATSANLPLLQNLNSGGAVKYLYRGGDLQAINPLYARYSGQSPGRGYIYSGGRQRTDFDIGSQGYLASKVYNPRSTANTFGNLANYAADRSGFLNKKYGTYTYNSEYSEKHSKEFGGSGSGWNSFTSRNPIPDYVRGFNAVSDSPYGSPKIAARQKFAMEDWAFNDILNNKEISRAPITGYRTSAVGSRYISGLIGGPPNHGDNGQNYDKVSLKDYMNELGFSKAGNQTFNGVSANKALAMGSLADVPGSNVGIAQQAISSIQTKGLGNLSVNNTDVAAATALDTIKNARMSHYNQQQFQPQRQQQQQMPFKINMNNTPAARFRNAFSVNPSQSFRFFANGGSTTDTQPAMLTPGEFVVSKPAVDRVGTAFLDRVNNYAKGGKVGYYQDGTGGSNSGSGPILGIDLKIIQSAFANIQDAAVSTASGAVQLGTNLVQAAGTITSSISLIDKVGAIMNSSSASMYSSSLAFERAVNNLASALDRVPKTITLAIAPLSLNVSFNTPSILAAIQQSISNITGNVAAMIDTAITGNNNDQMRA